MLFRLCTGVPVEVAGATGFLIASLSSEVRQ